MALRRGRECGKWRCWFGQSQGLSFTIPSFWGGRGPRLGPQMVPFSSKEDKPPCLIGVGSLNPTPSHTLWIYYWVTLSMATSPLPPSMIWGDLPTLWGKSTPQFHFPTWLEWLVRRNWNFPIENESHFVSIKVQSNLYTYILLIYNYLMIKCLNHIDGLIQY